MSNWFLPLRYVEVVNLADLVYVNCRLLVHIDFTFLHKLLCTFQKDPPCVYVVTIDRLANDIILSLVNITDA